MKIKFVGYFLVTKFYIILHKLLTNLLPSKAEILIVGAGTGEDILICGKIIRIGILLQSNLHQKCWKFAEKTLLKQKWKNE